MNVSLTTYWHGMANGIRCGVFDRLLTAALFPVSLVYAIAQFCRAWMYRTGILNVMRLPRPVISVGNIAVGGTGKTPVTAMIARLLIAKGLKVAVLSRGYGGSVEGATAVASDGKELLLTPEECGDEPFLLASSVSGLIAVIGSDRYAAGMLAMERFAPDVFLLDDGYQHLRLHRDLNILLMDGARPFGNGFNLPAGILREPQGAVSRADLIMFTRCEPGIEPDVRDSVPSCKTRHELRDVVSLVDGSVCSFDSLRGKKILAFAGIADPESFFTGLRRRGVNVTESLSLPDHAAYGKDTVGRIEADLQESCADFAITTEKDGVKLKKLPPRLADRVLLARMEILNDEPAVLESLLRNLLQKQSQV